MPISVRPINAKVLPQYSSNCSRPDQSSRLNMTVAKTPLGYKIFANLPCSPLFFQALAHFSSLSPVDRPPRLSTGYFPISRDISFPFNRLFHKWHEFPRLLSENQKYPSRLWYIPLYKELRDTPISPSLS